MDTNQTVQPASTLVCCNVTTKWPYKILFVKRSEKATFLPGAYVFPGGRMDVKDKYFAAWLKKDRVNLDRIAGYFPSGHQTAERIACALRETLEETGISALKISTNQQNFYLTPPQLAALIEESAPKGSPILDHLWPISWWITPEGEARRYDTNFFLCLVESDKTEMVSEETSHPHWWTPKEALEHYERHEIFLAPPTRALLHKMEKSHSFEELLASLDVKLNPICPYFKELKGEKYLVLPGDPLHHEPKRSDFIEETRFQFP